MKSKKIPPAGEIRQSQILSTYGPGSMLDLPNKSVIVGGLNHWLFGEGKKRIFEERLEDAVSKVLGRKGILLYEPPSSNKELDGSRTGIRTFTFPTWFVAQIEEVWKSPAGKEYRTRPLLSKNLLSKGKYNDLDDQKRPVVPVRFVQACVNGHISDIDWYAFVHQDSASSCNSNLWLDESGTGGDFPDIFIRCEVCQKRRPLSDTTITDKKALGVCQGSRPWLGLKTNEKCMNPDTGKPAYNRLLVRSASNAYFSQIINVISLPDGDQQLRESVNQVYEEFLQYAQEQDDIRRERRKERVANALEGFSDEIIWHSVQRRKSNLPKEDKTIKQIEIETLLSSPDAVGEDQPEGDFYARNRHLQDLNEQFKDKLERIVLVHRLREVVAQIGFTRFEAAIPDIDGELKLNVTPAALDLDITWVPAIENKGEGIFLSFQQEAIYSWLAKESVQQRGTALNRGFDVWLKRKGISSDKLAFPGLPYIMLHSLSHLLITTLSLECGYSASAIRERIYAGTSGYGILLYTGSSSSEGTLGGLVQEGTRIENHLISALELGKLCSNDPVCAVHKPNETYEERFLHGAACHGCLLIAETSCERQNEFLDRALVVETVEDLGAAFFCKFSC